MIFQLWKRLRIEQYFKEGENMWKYFKEKIKKIKVLMSLYLLLIEVKNKYIKKRDAKYLQKNGLETLILLKEILDNLGIEFWLDTSTLLGAIREKNFIQGDNDLGIGIELKNYSIQLEKELEKNGIILIREFSIDNKKYGLEQTYIFKGVEIDIFYHTRTENITKYHSFIYNKKNPTEYIVKEAIFPFKGLTELKFLGEYFKVPKNYIEYTEVKYGKDYMNPNPNWTMADEKNAVILKDKVGKYKGKI